MEGIEQRLAARRKILRRCCEANGVLRSESSVKNTALVTGRYQRPVLPRIGPKPQEAPQAFGDAVLAMLTFH
jgi:hypothetical protein